MIINGVIEIQLLEVDIIKAIQGYLSSAYDEDYNIGLLTIHSLNEKGGAISITIDEKHSSEEI